MATSNSTNFALNAQQICEAALRLARVLGIGQAVDAEITVDIDQVGDGTAKGLKVVLIGTRA